MTPVYFFESPLRGRKPWATVAGLLVSRLFPLNAILILVRRLSRNERFGRLSFSPNRHSAPLISCAQKR